jgi:serine/threonine protein kinase
MPLTVGDKLGPYEILGPIGAGGMGEVYKARDTRLDRAVAIKVLPSQLAAHPELRQRLEREARAVSSLNHPHICTLYDVGEVDGIVFLVLEYLAGETLAARLKNGPLPLATALLYAVEIAEALDQAHRKNVVHRDLKPGNVMLTKSGSKLLDFGLAKVREATKSDTDNAATLTFELTSQGTILGTLQYMAPEQVEGKEADARSDIFAFGAVLYEMITGRKAFNGKSQPSLIAAILTAEPPPISSLQSVTPPALDRVVRTCLAKDPDARWQSAGDLGRELKWIADPEFQAEFRNPRAGGTKSRGARIAWVVAAAAALAALSISWIHFRAPAPEQRSIRFTIPTEARLPSQVRVSPDGTRLAFVGQNAPGKIVLWVRSLDKLISQALPGTEGAMYPFWSPDSRHIGYFDLLQGKLKTIDASGGQPQILANAIFGLGGDWGSDGTIIFAPGSPNSGIYRIASNGRVPVQITTPRAYIPHGFPSFLPDGRHFLFLGPILCRAVCKLKSGFGDVAKNPALLVPIDATHNVP